MTSFSEPAWRRPASADDHPQLLAWEAELEAERAPVPTCTCFHLGEFSDFPCDVHRSEVLADIDRDGHDDKREIPRGAA